MTSELNRSVVILYEHALLGEGIAKFLRAQIGVEAMLGSANDPLAVQAAVELDPAVVIFESANPIQKSDLRALVPHAVLIDVSTVITRGSAVTPGVAGLEQILEAVRESRNTLTHPSVTSPAVNSTAVNRPARTTPEPAL